MKEEKLSLMEMAIMDGVASGMIERTDIGKHARTIVSDYDAAGPTLWTEQTTRKFADLLEGLVEKGYLAWKVYILALEPTEKGKKFIDDHKTELENLPGVDDRSKWFTDEWLERHTLLSS